MQLLRHTTMLDFKKKLFHCILHSEIFPSALLANGLSLLKNFKWIQIPGRTLLFVSNMILLYSFPLNIIISREINSITCVFILWSCSFCVMCLIALHTY